MLFRDRTMLLLGLLNASLVQAKIMDDINLICDYYLIAVTTTFAQDFQNIMKDDLERKDITYDVVTLFEGQLAPSLNPKRHGWITDTEISISTDGDSFTYNMDINRQSGMAVESKWVGNSRNDGKWITVSQHNCTPHSRKVLDNIITRHNRAIKESTSNRKF